MRFVIVTTSVITAQSIITKVNKSLYVTIGTSSLLLMSGNWHIAPFGSLSKHIIKTSIYIFKEQLRNRQESG